MGIYDKNGNFIKYSLKSMFFYINLLLLLGYQMLLLLITFEVPNVVIVVILVTSGYVSGYVIQSDRDISLCIRKITMQFYDQSKWFWKENVFLTLLRPLWSPELYCIIFYNSAVCDNYEGGSRGELNAFSSNSERIGDNAIVAS